MPGIFHRPLDRRSFLKATALAGGGLLLPGCCSTMRETAGGEARWKLALLSDTHVAGDRTFSKREFNPWDNLRRVVSEVTAAQPQATFLNGDAALLEGLPVDYVEVQGLLQPLAEAAPVYIGLGNHDDRLHFFETFQNPPGLRQTLTDKHVVIVEHDVVRMIVLDSLLYVNHTAGLLGHAQRDWLADTLPKLDDRPAVIFVHHSLGDGDGDLLDTDAMFDMIRPHRHVKAVFYGHSHQWKQSRRDRAHLINLPAVGYNFNDEEPVGWVEASFDRAGVDLTLHAIGGNVAGDGKLTRVEWA